MEKITQSVVKKDHLTKITGRSCYVGDYVGDILKNIKVEYEVLEPVLDLRQATHAHFDYEYGKGDLEKAFAEADKVYVEEFETGYQDQAYIECQGMMAEPEADGRMFVHGSMQCAYYVHGAVARVLGVGPEGVGRHRRRFRR